MILSKINQLNKTYILDAIILWLCAPIGTILLIFIPNSAITPTVAMQHEIVMRSVHFLYLIIFAYILQVNINKRLFCKQHILLMICTFFWIMVTPVLVCQVLPSLTADITFGLHLFLILISLQAVILSKNNIILALFWSVVILASYFLGGVDLLHYSVYEKPCSNNSITAILQTDIDEALEWLMMKLNMVNVIIIVLTILFSQYVMIYLAKKSIYDIKNKKIQFFITLILAIIAFMYLYPKTHVGQLIYDELSYNKTNELFLDNREKIKNQIQITSNQGDIPHTVFLIIGESASRDYMHAYNKNYQYDDTPWMESQIENGNAICVKNVYASYNLTVISVPKIITSMSQYNDENLEACVSIVDVAKSAGYKVYWLGTQSTGKGKWDAGISMIANTADEVIDAKNDDGKKAKYDEAVLKDLQNINQNENNLIIIHLTGSHAKYDMRYPDTIQSFDNTLEGKYATSILYTDSVLQKIYNIGKDRFNIDVMVYTSDHGEDMEWQHGVKQLWNNYHVPFVIWLSDRYKKDNPEQYINIMHNKEKAFSNDMTYNTLCGMLNMKSNYYDSSEDYSSKEYSFDKNNVKVVLGKYNVSGDNGLNQIDK